MTVPVHYRVVISGGIARIPKAEAVLRRPFITQVPVTHIAALVTGAREDIGQHHFVFERRRRRGLALRRSLNGLRREEILDAVLARHAAREQRGQAGRVRRRAYQMILEARSGLRQLIDVGRQDLAIAGAPKHPGAEAVGDNQNDVRARTGAFFTGERGRGQTAQQEFPAVEGHG